MKTYLKPKESRIFLAKRMAWGSAPEQGTEKQVTATDVGNKIDELKKDGVEFKEKTIKALTAPEINKADVIVLLQRVSARDFLAKQLLQDPNGLAKGYKNDHQKFLLRTNSFPGLPEIFTNENVKFWIGHVESNTRTLQAMQSTYMEISDTRPQGKESFIFNTNLPKLTKAETDALLAMDNMADAKNWLKNNKRRNYLIGELMGKDVAVMGGKSFQAKNIMKPFTAKEAKTYRDMEPDDAVRILETVQKETEIRKSHLAESKLEADLGKM